MDESERAMREGVRGAQNIEDYLRLTAPFDGVITERNMHPGSKVLILSKSSAIFPPVM